MNDMTYLSFVANTLILEHSALGTWDEVAKKYGRPKGTLWRIANEPGFCPGWLKRNIKHLAHQHVDLYAMPKDQLLWSLENRS